MQYTVENLHCPIYPKQDYIWFAEYDDGNRLYEFESKHKENSFSDIVKEKVKCFGLIGHGICFKYHAEDGKFDIGGQEYEIELSRARGELVNFSSTIKDPITFKMGHTDGIFSGRKLKKYIRSIDGYFFGFKTLAEDNIFLQIVFGIPMTGRERTPFFGVKASCQDTKEPIPAIASLKSRETVHDSKPMKISAKSSAVNLYFSLVQ